MTDRGVSDVVGFTLIFSVVLLSVGAVTAGGFSVLTDINDRQQVENSERGLSAFGATVDSLHRSGDTTRHPSLTIGDGELIYNTSQINVTSDDDDFNDRLDSGLPNGGNLSADSLEHHFDRSGEDVVVQYEAGAVFRSQSASPRYGPSIDIEELPNGETQAIVSLVNLSAGEQISRNAPGVDNVAIRPTSLPDDSLTDSDNFQVDFRAELTNQSRVIEHDFDNELRVDVSDASDPARWDQYFNGTDTAWESTGSGVYSIEPDTVLVRVTTVRLTLPERLPE